MRERLSAGGAVLERDREPADGEPCGQPYDRDQAGERRARRRHAPADPGYSMAHLDEPIDVATLAGMCGRSQFHFFADIPPRGRRQSVSLYRSPASSPRRRTGARWQAAAGRDRGRHRLRRSEPPVPMGKTGARRIDDPADKPAGEAAQQEISEFGPSPSSKSKVTGPRSSASASAAREEQQHG